MGQKPKTPKGEISITNFEGRVRLRWRYAGKRYSLNLPYAYLPENLQNASIKVAEIKLDMLKGIFDTSLQKYKTIDISPHLQGKKYMEQNGVEDAVHKVDNQILLKGLIPKFNVWATAVDSPEIRPVGVREKSLT